MNNKVILQLGVVLALVFYSVMHRELYSCDCSPDSAGNYLSPAEQDIDESKAKEWGYELDSHPVRQGESLLVKVMDKWQIGYAHNNPKSGPLEACLGSGLIERKLSQEKLRRLLPFLARMYEAHPTIEQFLEILKQAKDCLPNLPSYHNGTVQALIVPPGSSIIVNGDIHGDIRSLRTNLHVQYHKGLLDENYILPKNCYSVYLGDYADRGNHGAEVWALLSYLKNRNPNLFLLRGNHETPQLANFYGFRGELLNKYGFDAAHKLGPQLVNLFLRLPQALLIGAKKPKENSYRFGLFCHGGIELRLTKCMQKLIDEVVTLHRQYQADSITQTDYFNLTDDSGLMWSDFFACDPQSFMQGGWPSRRGAQQVFDYDKNFIKNHLKEYFWDIDNSKSDSYTLDFIVRGHGHIPGGIVELKDLKKDDADWDKLESEKKYPIKPYSVYSCTSSELPEQKCNEDAFAVINIDNEGEWSITPHIQPIKK